MAHNEKKTGAMVDRLGTSSDYELLPPALTRQDVLSHERKATKLYETGQRTVVQFAAELARLQDGQAHLLRGFTDFGEYAADRFEGLSARNAFQISRQGRVLLVLERAGKINIDKAENLPGTTGLRSLAKLLKDLGEETMIAIHDKAAESGKVTDERVAAATASLIAPVLHELGAGMDEAATVDPEEDEEDGGYEDEYPPKVRELIEQIRDLSWDLPQSADQLKDTTERLQAELKGENTKEDQKWVDSKR